MFKPYHRSPQDVESDSKYLDLLQHCTIAKIEPEKSKKNITQHWNKISKSYLSWVDFKNEQSIF